MQILHGHRNSVRALAFSPDGRTLASAGDDGTVHFWDGITGDLLHVWAGFERPVQCLAFAPDGGTVFAAGDEGIVGRWDCDGAQVMDPLATIPAGIVAMALSPDGRLLAVGVERFRLNPIEERSTLLLYDVAAECQVMEGDQRDLRKPIWSLAFAPDDSALAVGRGDGRILFVSLDRGRGRKRILGRLAHTVGIRALAFAPDGRTLVASAATPLLVYDVAGKVLLHRLGEPRYAFESLAFCPDGTTLATGCQDSTVRLWDARLGYEKGRFDWKLGPIYAVAVSPDGMRAAAGGFAREVVLFDVDP